MGASKAMVEDKIDVSEVSEDDRNYPRAYFALALGDSGFRSCKVTLLHPGERRVCFHVVFDDGRSSSSRCCWTKR